METPLCSQVIEDNLLVFVKKVYQSIEGALYRQEGEISGPCRELSILLLQNVVLLNLQAKESDITFDENTLIYRLIKWTGSFCPHDIYDCQIPSFSKNFVQELISSITLPNFKLSEIPAKTWAGIYSDLIKTVNEKRLSKRKRQNLSENFEPDIDKIFPFILDEIEVKKSDKISEKSVLFFLTGPISTHIFSNLPINGCTITERLKQISDILLFLDTNPLNIATVRFLIAIRAINGEFGNSSHICTDFENINDIFKNLDRNIRAGSPIFDSRINDEFISEKASYQTLSEIHPLGINKMVTGENDIVLISSTDFENFEKCSQVLSYLVRNFLTFSPGVCLNTLLAEYQTEPQISTKILILPSCWLSERIYSPFRRWVKNSPIKTLVLPFPEDLKTFSSETILIFAKTPADASKMSDNIKIIEIGDEKYTEFLIKRSSLPDHDGWKIFDTTLIKSINAMKFKGIPLIDYTLNCLYPDDGTYHSGTFINLLKGELHIEKKGPAIFVIPGDDLYLEAILESEIMREFWRNITAQKTKEEQIHQIKSLPIPIIDWYNPSESKIALKIEHLMKKRRMLQLKSDYLHAAHDRKRVSENIQRISNEIEALVRDLFC